MAAQAETINITIYNDSSKSVSIVSRACLNARCEFWKNISIKSHTHETYPIYPDVAGRCVFVIFEFGTYNLECRAHLRLEKSGTEIIGDSGSYVLPSKGIPGTLPKCLRKNVHVGEDGGAEWELRITGF